MPRNNETIKDLVQGYSSNIETIRDFITLVEPILNKVGEKQFSKDVQYLWPILALVKNTDKNPFIDYSQAKKIAKKQGFDIDIKDGDITYKGLTLKQAKEIEAAHKRLDQSYKRSSFLLNTSLISLISAAEWFFCQLLHFFYNQHPKIVISESDKTFTYKELSDFDSIEDAKDFLIEKKVESIIRSSFPDWIDLLEKQFKIEVKHIKTSLQKAHEYFLRRNLLVHNGGKVNNIYIKKIEEYSGKNSEMCIDEQVSVDTDYLTEATHILEIIFIDIASQLWIKSIKSSKNKEKDMQEYFDVLNSEIAYPHLLAERYHISEHISARLKDNMNLPEECRLISLVNYWLSIKYQDRFDEIKSEVEQYDFSAKDLNFQVAQKAILEENEDVFRMLPRIYNNEGINIDSLKEWPLFKIQRRNKKRWGQMLKSIKNDNIKEQNQKLA